MVSTRIIQADALFVAAYKLPGEPTSPDPTGDPSLLDLLASHFDGPMFPVHRLDRPASGAVIFARTSGSAAALSSQFAGRSVSRCYLAIVSGALSDASGSLRHSIIRVGRTNRSRAVQPGDPDGREAELTFKVLAQGDRYSLLEVTIVTGRHHQIRAQLAAIGHPIRGDVKYGARRGLPDRSISLHAHRLTISHPESGAALNLVAPPPVRDVWTVLMNLSREREFPEA